MNIKLLCIGKTDDKRIESLIEEYSKRLNYYVKFSVEVIPDLKKAKNFSQSQQKEKEGDHILSSLKPQDHLVILDENGKEFTSLDFSKYLQKKMNAGYKTLVLAVGGPYGFSEAVYKRAQGKIALSQMTFSHQMIRLFIAEQLYSCLLYTSPSPRD